MREIKFRAWDKRRNIFGKVTMLENYLEADYKKNFDHKGRVSLFNIDNETDCGFWGSWIEYVDLEQYTGLKDKNGKEIYEGDILDEDDGPAIVVFHDSSWALEMSDEDEAAIEPFSVYIIDNMEVIGNIHENPELLEAEDA